MTFLSHLFRFRNWTLRIRSRSQRRHSPIFHNLERLETRELLTTFLVNSTDDTTAAGTLRWAIEQANNNSGADSIEFDTQFSAPQTIVLGGNQLPAFSDRSGLTTLTGPGLDLLTVSGNDLSRVFTINENVSVKISDLTISHGHAEDDNGGGIEVAGELTLVQVFMTNNSATSGGGIHVAIGGELNVSLSTFQNNSSINDGGAISNNGSLEVTGTHFTNNASIYGGAVSSNTFDGPTEIFGGSFVGNAATQIGGAIYNYGSGLKLSQSSLHQNSSAQGGAIANLGGGSLQLNTVFLYENTATMDGGGLLNGTDADQFPSVATIISGSIHDNVAKWGGGIANSGTLLIQAGLIEQNSATNFGGGIANSGTLTMSATTLNENTVELAGTGGGISNFGTLAIANSTFSKNYAGIGGGIYNNHTLSVTDSNFIENSSTYHAGAIWNWGAGRIDSTSFTSNNSDSGAGVYNVGTLEIWQSQFQFNTANGSGGAFSNQGRATLYWPTFLDNQATYEGGAISNSQSSQLSIYDGIFARNSAREGGAILNDWTSTLLVDTARISANSADWNGGGILNRSTATLNLSNAMLVDNTADKGGGIYNAGSSQIVNTTIARNTANYGGGIYHGNEAFLNARLVLLNATVADNHTSFGGGGLHLAAGNDAAWLVNTIVARNDRSNIPDDINGTVDVVRSTNNLIGPGGSGGLNDQINQNIVLGPNDFLGLGTLDTNGGFTLTMALLPFSPAIDAGKNGTDLPLYLPFTDQRGFRFDTQHPRQLGMNVDIGAFESHHGSFVINHPESTAPVTITLLDDSYPQPVTFAMTGGDDQARFGIDPATGALTFLTPPDFEQPADTNRDNSYEVRVSVTDGLGIVSQQVITINIVNSVEVSSIFLASDPITIEIGATQAVDSGADFDPDAAVTDYSTARLVVSITQGRRLKDQLQIVSQGTGTGQIKVKGSKVLFGGVVIGTVERATKTNPDLTVRFFATTTAGAVRALLKRISFSTKNKDAEQLARVIEFQIHNLAGASTNRASRQIQVVPKS